MAEVDDNSSEEEEAGSKGGGLPLILAGVGAAVVLGGGAAGWFTGVIPGLLGMGPEEEIVAEAEMADGEEPAKAKAKPKGKKKKGKKGEDENTTTIVALEPIIISLPAPNQIRRKLPRLNVAIALEVTDAEYTEEKRPQLRNDLISTIRLIDAQTLNSPEGLDTLRSTIEESAGEVLGASLKQVLITEFILL
ncbi:MAG: flagellar basal body-associated FliL family protein [Pseudomonadota bacterium]